jgi:hypothetical protein
VLDLLDKAKIPAYNAMVIKAVATEVWNARQSNDDPSGSPNPTGNILFNAPLQTRPSRSLAAGHIRVPASGRNTFVRHGAEMYNRSTELREARNKGKVKREASILAKGCPCEEMRTDETNN